jgi:cell shape-determining protein MreC
MYEKYVPNYKEKYDEVIDTYELVNEKYNFIPAQTMGFSNYKIDSIFYLNKGLNNGVMEGSYVVSNEGLVGVIKKVYKNYSIAQLISSKSINIAVEINGCYGSLNNSVISDLLNCDDININDPVFTSKYSISSSNILVGYIDKITDNKIYVRYVYNPYKIRFVGIIYDN